MSKQGGDQLGHLAPLLHLLVHWLLVPLVDTHCSHFVNQPQHWPGITIVHSSSLWFQHSKSVLRTLHLIQMLVPCLSVRINLRAFDSIVSISVPIARGTPQKRDKKLLCSCVCSRATWCCCQTLPLVESPSAVNSRLHNVR